MLRASVIVCVFALAVVAVDSITTLPLETTKCLAPNFFTLPDAFSWSYSEYVKPASKGRSSTIEMHWSVKTNRTSQIWRSGDWTQHSLSRPHGVEDNFTAFTLTTNATTGSSNCSCITFDQGGYVGNYNEFTADGISHIKECLQLPDEKSINGTESHHYDILSNFYFGPIPIYSRMSYFTDKNTGAPLRTIATGLFPFEAKSFADTTAWSSDEPTDAAFEIPGVCQKLKSCPFSAQGPSREHLVGHIPWSRIPEME